MVSAPENFTEAAFPRRLQYIASQVERQKQLVDDVAKSLETLQLNVLADDDSDPVLQAAKTLREAAQRSVRPEAPPDSIQEAVGAGFGSGVSGRRNVRGKVAHESREDWRAEREALHHPGDEGLGCGWQRRHRHALDHVLAAPAARRSLRHKRNARRARRQLRS